MFTEVLRTCIGKRIFFSINGTGETRNPYVEQWNLTQLSPCTKISSKWIRLEAKSEPSKLLEENRGILQYIRIWINVWTHTPKVQETKTKLDKWDFIKVKNHYAAKATINKVKMLARYVFDKHLRNQNILRIQATQ